MSADVNYRTFTPDLEVRAASKGGDGRTIVGIAVPYDRPQRIDDRLTESFTRGSFAHQIAAAHRVPITRDHQAHGGRLIGRTLLLREDAAGLYGEWRVSATPTGDETLTLVRDGVLNHLSIGFREGQNRRLSGGVVQRVKAHLTEVAVVPEGAYGDEAAVTEVRHLADDGLHVCGECGSPLGTGVRRLDQAAQLLAGLPVLPV
jgi:HK97 family phage prohead protease